MIKYFVFFALCFFACNEAVKEVKVESSLSEKTEKDYGFQVYHKFDDIKYIFNYENDTTYVINFWATWCKPCVAELPYFEKLNSELKDKKIKVILVSLDFKKQIESKLVPFIQDRKIKSEVILLLDDKAVNWIDQVDVSWSGSIPATVFYNKEYWQFYEGEFESYTDIENIVNSFLN